MGGASLLGGGGKGGDDQTSTASVEIPGFLNPLIGQQIGVGQQALTGLQQQLGSNFGVTGQDLVAGFTPDQLQAQALGRERALGGGGFIPAAQQQFLQTAQGNAIDAPGFQSAFEASLRRAQPNISSAFSLAGRSGSGLESTAQTQAAADAFAGLFNQERSRQLQAAGALPRLALADVGILEQIGLQQQQQQQAEINAPIAAQQQLLNAAGGGVPFAALLGQSSTQPIQGGGGLTGALGGGLTGAQLGSSFGPYGTAIGGGIGAIAGSGLLG